jgi:excisionase family DNA binding protein
VTASTRRCYSSVADEATRLGVGETTLLEGVRAGLIPHRRLGRRVLLKSAEVDAYLERTGVSLEDAVARTLEQRE